MKKTVAALSVIGLIAGATVFSLQSSALLANIIHATNDTRSNIIMADSGNSAGNISTTPPSTENVRAEILVQDPDNFRSYLTATAENPMIIQPGQSFSYLINAEFVGNFNRRGSIELADGLQIAASLPPLTSGLEYIQRGLQDPSAVGVRCWLDNSPSFNQESSDRAYATAFGRDAGAISSFTHALLYSCHYSAATGKFYYQATSGGLADVHFQQLPPIRDAILPSNTPTYLHILVGGLRVPTSYSSTTPICTGMTATVSITAPSYAYTDAGSPRSEGEACIIITDRDETGTATKPTPKEESTEPNLSPEKKYSPEIEIKLKEQLQETATLKKS